MGIIKYTQDDVGTSMRGWGALLAAPTPILGRGSEVAGSNQDVVKRPTRRTSRPLAALPTDDCR